MPLLVEAMASAVFSRVLPGFAFNVVNKPRRRARVRSLSDRSDSTVLPSDSVSVSGGHLVEERAKVATSFDKGNGRLGSRHGEKKRESGVAPIELEVLWDDGYGSKSVKDYLDAAKEFVMSADGGPPRWFCPVDAGQPLKDSPVLLFLPGLDGTGLGLTLHERALGKAFEVRCLHIPVSDRTPFEGLVKLVEETVRLEHDSFPNKPIFLVGESFGGCLALAIAARNPSIDLVVILANPATAVGRSQLQPLFPILEALPDGLHTTVPYLLSFVMGDPMKMATVNIESVLPPRLRFDQLSKNLIDLLPRLSWLADIIPKDTLLWKLKLLKTAAAYANSRLHAVRAEVLLLASGKDNMLPSGDEAQRLKSSIQNCKVRYFKNNGHTLLLEDGLNLLTVIKATCKYRRSRRLDPVSDFLPPSRTEFESAFNQFFGLFLASSSVMFSTLDDGKIVRGLKGIPDEGPVLLVGYHMLMGLELPLLTEGFLREKNILVRGVAHPELFTGKFENSTTEFSPSDWVKVFGALPVTARNLFKLLSARSHVLLYPGGAREALHYKGEQYKLFWPDQTEFVRMAARFGATIVPFAAVGEDDIVELVLDYNDLMRIPVVNNYVREASREAIRLRENMSGEVSNQELFFPGLLPKMPGRFYYLFGKPIETKGRKEMLKDREKAKHLYFQVKSEVERNITFLIKKREEDPYRNIIERGIYRAIYAPSHEVPTFEP